MRTRTQRQRQRQQQPEDEAGSQSRGHLLAGTPSRHDSPARAAAAATKGCATFLVEGDEGEAPRRVAVPVARLGHPRMRELLGEAREVYGYEHEGAVVVPGGVDRFMRAVEEASSAAAGYGHGHRHHFRLPHIHIARCFRRRTSSRRIHA